MSKKLYYSIFILFSAIFVNSCMPTKYLSDNQFLLSGNFVNIIDTASNNDRGYVQEDIEEILMPKPNSKILFIPFYLRLYNITKPEKLAIKKEKKDKKCVEKRTKKVSKLDRKIRTYQKERDSLPNDTKEFMKLDKKLKKTQNKKNDIKQEECNYESVFHKIGEPPVIYDKNDQHKTSKQIEIFFKNRGYYHVKVSSIADQIYLNQKKIAVFYTVESGKPHIIDSISYNIPDVFLSEIIKKDTPNSLIKIGNRLDANLLQQEQERLSDHIRDLGYYKFSKEYIYFTIDTLGGNDKAEIAFNIKQYRNSNGDYENHKQYLLNNVYIYTDFDPKKALAEKESYFSSFDTTVYTLNDKHLYYFLNDGRQLIKSKTIALGTFLYKDSLYNRTNVKDTYKYLATMKIIKIANLNFIPVSIKKPEYKIAIVDSLAEQDTIKQEYGYLDCELRLSKDKLQLVTFELEGTNSSGNIGAAGNLIYRNRNIFRHAEVFDLKLKSALQRQTNVSEGNANIFGVGESFFNSREFGFEGLMDFPRLLAPVQLASFKKRFSPKTIASLSYNYLSRPDYTRTVAGLSFGYFWSSSETKSHILKPIIFDLIEMKNPTQKFLDYIRNYGLQESYENHLILASGYTLILNNQKKSEKRNYTYIRLTGKSAGGLLKSIMDISHRNNPQEQYSIGNTVFAQFVKSDIDFRYYRNLPRENDKIVFRAFAGAAYPYGNLKVIPFGEKYFSGGANGVRAWQVRSLGPGSYSVADSSSSYLNLTADIKLEANAEYRMKLFWMLEGAFFVDIGNIWAINKQDDREGAIFEFNDFYKELAVGSGYGFRFDFDFFIIRFDFGLKIKDPSNPLGKRFIPFNRKFTKNDWAFNVGIGYPF